MLLCSYSEGDMLKALKLAIPLIVLIGLLFTALPFSTVGADEAPSKGLMGYKETLNVSFPKPNFYTSNDPHNGADVEANPWDDIAFVIMIQSGNRVTKTENAGAGGETASCADIYQAIFVTLDGKTISTGTQQRIMVEDFTATWCTYCTGVIGALNRLDMDETMFPDKYIGVEWHSGGGTYGVGEPLASAVERRDSYSLQGGIPRYVIDGVDPWVGGSSSANNTAIDDRIRSSISARNTPAMISIETHAGHTSNNAWVEFTFTVESDTFTNTNVEAHVALVQDAYPRRHGTNANARLGWIGQDIYTAQVLQKEAPLVQLKEDRMANDIDDLGHVEGVFEIQWRAEDKEDGNYLTVDLYYAKGRGDWVPIEMDVPNTGSYDWDTFDPRIPDGDDYKIKVVAMDSDDMIGEAALPFEFEINNPDPPNVVIAFPSEDGEVMTGTGTVRWWSSDDEDDKNLLSIDVTLSSDLGATFETLATDIPNSGSYSFDTSAHPDGSEYIIGVKATDPKGLTNSTISNQFTIFNNDPPENLITFPSEGEKVSGTIEFTWDTMDEEDEAEDMKYDLSIMNVDDGIWQKLVSSQSNTGSFEFDTLSLEMGDGDYQIRIMVRDSHGEYAEPHIVEFKVYNPDLPEVLNAQAPRSPVSGTAEFYYTLSDPDLGESELLTPTFHISKDGIKWDLLGEAVPNTGTFYLDTLDLEDDEYQIRITVADPVLTGQSTTFIYPEFEVNNPDTPSISLIGAPTIDSNNTGDIPISWSGEDADGDVLKYYLYYSDASLISWMPIYEAQAITSSSYIWNTSELESGDYILKIVVKDGTKADLQTEVLTQSFHIHIVEDVITDPKSGDKDSTTTSETDNTTLLIVVFVGIVFILIIVVMGMVLVLMKRKAAPVQMMPPPQQPAMPPAASGGPLPPVQQPQTQLPPQPVQQLPPTQPQQTYIPPQNPL